MNNTNELWQIASDMLKADLPMSVSEFADKYIVLPAGVSAEPGQWESSRTPYLIEPMNAVLDPVTESIALMTASQIGKSSLTLNLVGFYSAFDPSNIMIVQPTIQMAEEFSKTRIQPIIDATPILNAKYIPEKARTSSNTLLTKSFSGGTLFLTGANSPSSLASRSVRILVMDETDRFPGTVSDEGDIVEIALKRTTTFFNRKHIYTSTPTIAGASRIQSLFEIGSQSYFYVPCPACGEFFQFKNANFHYEHKGTDVVEGSCRMACTSCGVMVNESSKIKMLSQGKWIATYPDRVKHKSYQLNGFYSPWITWDTMADEFLKAVSKGPEALQPYTNLRFGEPWVEKYQQIAIDPEQLAATRTTRWDKLPLDILFVTCGMDVQADRIEAIVLGWADRFRTWTLEHRVFRGNPENPAIWIDVDAFLQKQYERSDGRMMGIDISCIDSNYQPFAVRNFTTPRFNRKVYAIVGKTTADICQFKTDESNNPYVVFSVDQIKATVFTRLDAPVDGYGHMAFHTDIATVEFFSQLVSEHQETKFERGVARIRWIQDRPRNEILDCYVYNVGATLINPPDFVQLAKNRAPIVVEGEDKVPVVVEQKKVTVSNPYMRPTKNWVTGYNKW